MQKVGSSSHCCRGKLAPISGSVEASDADSTVAAARELREETQLVAGKDLKLEFAGKPFHIEDASAERSWIVHPFGWRLVADEKKITLDWEHEGWQWTEPENVLSGRLQDDSVPRLDKSLRRVYFGAGSMFKSMTRESASGRALLAGLEKLRTDKESGARVLATYAVRCLIDVVKDIDSHEHWWHDLRVAAYHLIYSARPSMNAAISSAILGALSELRAMPGRNLDHQTVVRALQGCVARRDEMSSKISGTFVSHVKSLIDESSPRLTIMTLSSSSTIRSAIVELLDKLPSLHIQLYMLESRPQCEGASLAASLVASTKGLASRLRISLAPDSHMAQIAREAASIRDPSILLLGADRISPSGHVSNKMGSGTAAIVTKTLSPSTKVVVLSETDKIAKPKDLEMYAHWQEDAAQELSEHSPENNDPKEVSNVWDVAGAGHDTAQKLNNVGIEVRNIYFEWVASTYIDVYLTEEGPLKREEIRAKSMEKAELEEKLFGDLYEDD